MKQAIKSDQLRTRILAADLAWVPVALVVEQALRYGLRSSRPPLAPAHFAAYAACTLLAWILLSENLHLDGFRGGWRLPSVVSHLLLAVFLLMTLLLAVDNVSRTFVGGVTLGVFCGLLLLGFLCIRALALSAVLRRYRRGEVSRLVILGSDRLATELAAKFRHHPEWMCQVVGFLRPAGDYPAPREDGASPQATISTVEVADLLRQQQVHELVLAHTPQSREILSLVAFCRQRAIRVSLIPQPYELYLSRPQLVDLGGLPLLQLGELSTPAPARIGKRLVDLTLGCLLGLAILPLVLLLGATLRLTKGRAFRWEIRVGQQGNRFRMLRLNVERDCPYRSRFEWLLSQLSLSELPQFWNVLRGEMSLVGPRPEGPERTTHYSPWHQQRLAVRPGMTGLAQVHGLREQHSSEDKTRLDLQYLLRSSLLADLSLLIETIWTLTVRLITILKPGHVTARGKADAALPPIARNLNLESLPEIFQHAHRTQSGSD